MKKVTSVSYVEAVDLKTGKDMCRFSVFIGDVGEETFTTEGTCREIKNQTGFSVSFEKHCSITDFKQYISNLLERIEE